MARQMNGLFCFLGMKSNLDITDNCVLLSVNRYFSNLTGSTIVSSVNRYVSYRPIHSNIFVSACCSSLVENGSGSIYYTHRDFLNKKVSCKPYFAESCAWAKWNLTSQLDNLSNWLVTLASGHAEWNHLTSDRLSSRLVKSTFKVTTKESHPMLLSQEPPLRGTRGGGSGVCCFVF